MHQGKEKTNAECIVCAKLSLAKTSQSPTRTKAFTDQADAITCQCLQGKG